MEDYTSTGASGVRCDLQNAYWLDKEVICDLLACILHPVTIEGTLIFKLDPLMCSHNGGFSILNLLKAHISRKKVLTFHGPHSILHHPSGFYAK